MSKCFLRIYPILVLTSIVLCLFGLFPQLIVAQYPNPDQFRLQSSFRLVAGMGAPVRGLERRLIIENAIRGDFLWGKPGDEHFRLGPALELRTANYQTAEAGIGGSILLPVFRGYPITLTAIAGYALRRNSWGGDGTFIAGTMAWGYRSYNYHSRYGLSFNAYVSARTHFDQARTTEITGGIELDIELGVVIPVMMIRTALQNDAPDEPEEIDETEE